jgi:hypothetical protein
MFRYQGAAVVNDKGKVLEVHAGLDNENRNIVVGNQQNKIHQQWDIVYTDEWKGDPKKGELNKRFGLYVEREFYVISRLPKKRRLDLVGPTMSREKDFAIKIRNGRYSQVNYFHQQSLTIRTRHNNKSWDIQN